jgi:hypothetical protein
VTARCGGKTPKHTVEDAAVLAVMRPWGVRDLDVVQVVEPGSMEAALADLMGWPRR